MVKVEKADWDTLSMMVDTLTSELHDLYDLKNKYGGDLVCAKVDLGNAIGEIEDFLEMHKEDNDEQHQD